MMTIVIIVCSVVIVFGFVVFWGAPYVPSHRRAVEEAFTTKLYPLSTKDVLVDLGSGDGVVLRVASKKAGKVFGYELNPLLVVLSRLLSHGQNVEIRTANFWHKHFPKKTTVVYAFSVTRDMAKLETKLQQEADYMGRPLHLVLYAMQLPDREPVKTYRAHSLYRFTPLQVKKP